MLSSVIIKGLYLRTALTMSDDIKKKKARKKPAMINFNYIPFSRIRMVFIH